MNTPWGQADNTQTFANGVVWVSTPSHGGFYVPEHARATMPAALRAIPTFAGGNWYEEDCDATIIPLAFPQYFTAKQVNDADTAARAMRGYWKNADAVIAFLDSGDVDAVLVQANVELDQRAKGEPL